MILIATTASYVEFMQRLKEKFGYRKNAKCKVKDEDGDGMITLQDDEDLEIAISAAKKLAIRERAEHGKLEVSHINSEVIASYADKTSRSGSVRHKLGTFVWGLCVHIRQSLFLPRPFPITPCFNTTLYTTLHTTKERTKEGESIWSPRTSFMCRFHVPFSI